MRINRPEIENVKGKLQGGTLTVKVVDETRSVSEANFKCRQWLEITQSELRRWEYDENIISSLPEIKKLALDGVKFYDSVSVFEIKKLEESSEWYVKFKISVNNRVSYVDTYIPDYEIKKIRQNNSSYTNIGLVSIDCIIDVAFKKLEDKIEAEFMVLNRMISLIMERDGLRVACNDHDIVMSYNEWMCVDSDKIRRMYGPELGRHIPMIKSTVRTMVDSMIHEFNDGCGSTTDMRNYDLYISDLKNTCAKSILEEKSEQPEQDNSEEHVDNSNSCVTTIGDTCSENNGSNVSSDPTM